MHAAQAAMRARGVKVLVAVCAGAPRQAGWARYFTGASIWGQRAFLVLRHDAPERIIVTRSPDDAQWLQRTTIDTRVESTLIQKVAPVDRLIAIVAELVGGRGRVGFLNAHTLVPAEHDALREALPDVENIDMTAEMARLRQVKSPFEVKVIRDTGRLLASGLSLFAELARPGRPVVEATGDVDGHLRAKGCALGEARCALDVCLSAGKLPPARRFRDDDVIVLHLTYAGPEGYWYELAGVFSFHPLPDEIARRLRVTEDAMRASAAAAVPGATYGTLSAAVDRAFADQGERITGRYALDCHSIGTDEDEDPFPPATVQELRQGMVLALHPAPRLADGRGFLLAESFLVETGGAVPLSPLRAFHHQAGTLG